MRRLITSLVATNELDIHDQASSIEMGLHPTFLSRLDSVIESGLWYPTGHHNYVSTLELLIFIAANNNLRGRRSEQKSPPRSYTIRHSSFPVFHPFFFFLLFTALSSNLSKLPLNILSKFAPTLVAMAFRCSTKPNLTLEVLRIASWGNQGECRLAVLL